MQRYRPSLQQLFISGEQPMQQLVVFDEAEQTLIQIQGQPG
ncbi:hypothetical protein Q6D67_18620 [Haliea sp. E1-2-M8]|nr:hypothetical protein [Haliea sp. E1-2-M8]MDO8863710.1 hypothetical protein [Haliea sp. E1-2-M8]